MNAYRARNKNLPKAPKTSEDINLDNDYGLTNDKKRFALFDTKDDERIICFTSDTQLKVLHNCEHWYVDGTFSSSPQHYSQLYIIRGWFMGEMYPCAYVALKNKSENTYKRMLQLLIDNSSWELKPKVINGDFEPAAIMAWYAKFPGIIYQGCNFHFNQAINRNISEKGLQREYCTSHIYRSWLKLFSSLAFLPPIGKKTKNIN